MALRKSRPRWQRCNGASGNTSSPDASLRGAPISARTTRSPITSPEDWAGTRYGGRPPPAPESRESPVLAGPQQEAGDLRFDAVDASRARRPAGRPCGGGQGTARWMYSAIRGHRLDQRLGRPGLHAPDHRASRASTLEPVLGHRPAVGSEPDGRQDLRARVQAPLPSGLVPAPQLEASVQPTLQCDRRRYNPGGQFADLRDPSLIPPCTPTARPRPRCLPAQ
jgi:hypothetical protein